MIATQWAQGTLLGATYSSFTNMSSYDWTTMADMDMDFNFAPEFFPYGTIDS